MPQDAHLIRDHETLTVKVAELQPGDRVLIRPGEKVPVDGVVVEGSGTMNESLLTGESKPVPKHPGDKVIGGAINGEGSVVAEVNRTGKETYLNQVITLVRQAQESKSRAQDLANRAALWLVIVALSVGAITFAGWLLLGQGIGFAVERAATVMVIACPHALGLAVPLVIAVSTALAAKSGLSSGNGRHSNGQRTSGQSCLTRRVPLPKGHSGLRIFSCSGSAVNPKCCRWRQRSRQTPNTRSPGVSGKVQRTGMSNPFRQNNSMRFPGKELRR